MKTKDPHDEKWSIKIYSGSSPLQLFPEENNALAHITRKDVTDIKAAFVADPFMLCTNDIWYLFMEILNAETGLGEIGLMTSLDGALWNYGQVVLKEDYHLSYPFVFEHEGQYYMIPETLDAGSIRLYRAINFPNKWEFQTDLVQGAFADPTLFWNDGIWWLFACERTSKSGTLCLFYSDRLEGPYIPHPQSPIVKEDRRKARPAGRILVLEDKIIRVCQDCYPRYGSAVRAFQITQLSTTTYEEQELIESPILKASEAPKQWNTRGMHHIDAFKINENHWLACVDGCYSEARILEPKKLTT
ncbi:hypothetical protein POV27_15285 [Aureisphaera galaxeae]|uniref:glucosamine inositolphosphorylceramide transferase family protein n=1 Tax=Aureisphaera galaxeae TaxID=1538023 RepID=UPI00235021E3|nr:hypothetical protein [Aureisphaera galaxeae]MDC8005426.1 hypothetical protein [Aureisphaera galaxeae]